jgi:hypothetical protein
LRIWVDLDSLAGDPSLNRLLGFRTHPDLEIKEIKLEQITLRSDGSALLEETSKDFHRQTGFLPAAHNLEVLGKWGVALDYSADPLIDKRMILAMFARGSCDALVTRSAQLLEVGPIHYEGANAMALAPVLAALGLFLRLREDFVYRHYDDGRTQTSGMSFYAMLAHSLLPNWWRWRNLCPQTRSLVESSPARLTEAVHIRVTRMLRARDRMHGQLLRVPSDASIDEASSFFDSFLVAFAGAFDCVARTADRLYGIDRPKQAGWRKTSWLAQLEKSDPMMARLVSKDSSIGKLIDILFLLRNTIHEEALLPVGVIGPSDRIDRFEVAIPKDSLERLWDCCESLGGVEAWGLTSFDSEVVTINLASYAEKVVVEGTGALNQLLDAIPVERFGVKGPSSHGPPPHYEHVYPSIRDLAGLA